MMIKDETGITSLSSDMEGFQVGDRLVLIDGIRRRWPVRAWRWFSTAILRRRPHNEYRITAVTSGSTITVDRDLHPLPDAVGYYTSRKGSDE